MSHSGSSVRNSMGVAAGRGHRSHGGFSASHASPGRDRLLVVVTTVLSRLHPTGKDDV